MSKIFFKLFPVLFFWGIFIALIFKIPYPDSLVQANLYQIIPFFVPLFLALILTFNIFFRNIFFSASISLGIILVLVLKALDSLNIITGVLILIAVALLVSYFRKTKKPRSLVNSGFKNLTKQPKIPRLTRLQKQK